MYIKLFVVSDDAWVIFNWQRLLCCISNFESFDILLPWLTVWNSRSSQCYGLDHMYFSNGTFFFQKIFYDLVSWASHMCFVPSSPAKVKETIPSVSHRHVLYQWSMWNMMMLCLWMLILFNIHQHNILFIQKKKSPCPVAEWLERQAVWHICPHELGSNPVAVWCL